jgi:uncharacterized protein (DUF1330 family)
MAAYLLFIREDKVHNPAEMEAYGKKAGNARAGHNFDLLALYGAMETFEGKPADGIVMLKFATVDEAKAWYNSPAYQDASVHRKAGANYRVILVQGL